MLSSTQVLRSVLMQTLGICWSLRTSSFLITSHHYDVLALGCLLDWLRTGMTGSLTKAWGAFLGVVLLGIGTWGYFQVLIGPGRGDGAWDQWEVTLDSLLSRPLLAGAC